MNIIPFEPTWWLPGTHSETIYAKLRQPPLPDYRRELRLDSSGQTQVAYDFIDSTDAAAPLVVLFTGLEGSSDSHYARALMLAVKERSWNGVVAHFRGCGGVENTAPLAYHAGDSGEAAFVLNQLATEYRTIFAMGVSLGGNILAKYMGEQGDDAVPKAAAVISAPLNLTESAATMADSHLSTLIYSPYFLTTLRTKARDIAKRYPNLGLDPNLHCWTLPEFDTKFTIKLYGFSSLQDYYAQCSAFPKLKDITHPTLIINAQNDPLLHASALPTEQDVSSAVQLYQPERGGHVGFVNGDGLGQIDWLPHTVLTFFAQI